MSGPDDGLPGAAPTDSASVPPAPPSFGHQSDPPPAVTAPNGLPLPVQGPPPAPWWAPDPADSEDQPPGVLVAGPGVPPVDTRRAVPPTPLRPKKANPTSPDGIPVPPPVTPALDSPPILVPDAIHPPGSVPPQPSIAVIQFPSPPAATPQTGFPAPPPAEAPSPPPPAEAPSDVTPQTAAQGGSDAAQTVVDGVSVQAPAVSPGEAPEQPPMEARPVAAEGVSSDAMWPGVQQAAPAESAPWVPPTEGGPQTVVDMAARPSADVPAAPAPAAKKNRVLVYGAIALVPAIAAGFAGYFVLTGDGEKKPRPAAAPSVVLPPLATTPATEPAPSPSSPPPTAEPADPAVNSSKTDPKPISLKEVFPVKAIPLNGREFVLDRRSLNKRCDYVARGALARALLKGKCQIVARSTFISTDKQIGATVGVVAMPTKNIAVRVQKAGVPRDGNWFAPMPGKRTKAVATSGGWAASTTYGRYILYAYVQSLGDKPDDPSKAALGQVAKDFIGYMNDPLKTRL